MYFLQPASDDNSNESHLILQFYFKTVRKVLSLGKKNQTEKNHFVFRNKTIKQKNIYFGQQRQ